SAAAAPTRGAARPKSSRKGAKAQRRKRKKEGGEDRLIAERVHPQNSFRKSLLPSSLLCVFAPLREILRTAAAWQTGRKAIRNTGRGPTVKNTMRTTVAIGIAILGVASAPRAATA